MKKIYQVNAEGYSTVLLKTRKVYRGFIQYLKSNKISYKFWIYIDYCAF